MGEGLAVGPPHSALRRAILPIGLLLLLLLFVHACIPDPITDLKLVEAKRLTASALPEADELRERLMREDEAVWKLTFTGDAGWVDEVRQHELNGYALVVRCNTRHAGLLSLGPYVGDIPISYYGEGLRDFDPGRGRPLRYDVYIPEKGRYRSESDFNAPMPRYDFGRERKELCVSIAGGAMHGAYNRSNEVRVMIGSGGQQ
jgi:hypothetical protein